MAAALAVAVAITAAGGLSGLAYSWLEARHFALRESTIPVLPPGSQPLRILHLSDIHLMNRQHRKADFVRRVAALDVDLAVSTGDSIAESEAIQPVLELLAPALRRPGVFVFGSNDYFAPHPKNPARYLLKNGGKKRILGNRLPTSALTRGFTDAGWVNLSNARGSLDIAGRRVDFVGVDDPHLHYDRYDDIAGRADPAALLTIGVSHAPYRRILDAMAIDGAELLLTGHTHGGQLCLPKFGALVTNCDLPRRQAKGVSRWPVPGRTGEDAAWLHVSAGIGTAPSVAVRFACRPEASILTLVAADAA